MNKNFKIKDDKARPSVVIWEQKDLPKGDLSVISAGNSAAKGTAYVTFEHPESEEPLLFTGKQLYQLSKLTTAIKYKDGMISGTTIKDFSIVGGKFFVG